MQNRLNVEVGRDTGDAAVVRIQEGSELLAEVVQERDDLCVALHPRQDGAPWTLGCSQLEDLLRQAKLRVVRA